MKTKLKELKNHLMTGISYILPLVIGASLTVAVPKLIALAFGISSLDIYAEQTGFWHFMYMVEQTGWTGIGLLNTVLGGFIAYSIADKPALAPGLIAGAIASKTGSGFLGALIGAFLVGYVVKFLKDKVKLKGSFAQVMPLIIIPFIATGLVAILLAGILSNPLTAINKGLIDWIRNQVATGQSSVVLAAVLGGMICFDLGGPVNKAAWTAGNLLLLEGVYTPAVFINCAIIIPPIAYAIAPIIFRKKYSKKFKDAGLGNIVMGVIGITEGAIPFTLASPIKLTVINIIGGSVGTAIAAFLGARASIPPLGGLYGFITLESGWAYLVGAIVGAVIIAVLASLFVDFSKEDEEEVDINIDDIQIEIE